MIKKFLDLGMQPLANKFLTKKDLIKKKIEKSYHLEVGFDTKTKLVSILHTISSKKMFDVVIALEVVEHVKDIDLFIDSCAALTSKGGVTILATLNRTTKSFLLAIVGAEYLLRWLPRGTHDWSKFVQPSEIYHALRRNNITTKDISGFNYNILTDTWSIRKNPSVNYVILGVK